MSPLKEHDETLPSPSGGRDMMKPASRGDEGLVGTCIAVGFFFILIFFPLSFFLVFPSAGPLRCPAANSGPNATQAARFVSNPVSGPPVKQFDVQLKI